MRIFICIFSWVLIIGHVSGQSPTVSAASATHAPEQIKRPDFTITNAGAGIITYNPTGHYLAVAAGETIRIYDTGIPDGRTPNWTRTLTGHAAQILGLGFSGPNTLVSVSLDQTARIWNIDTGKLLHTTKMQLDKQLCFAIAPGKSLAADTSSGRVRLWNFEMGEVLKSFEPGDSWASVLAFTPDEKSLVIGTEKGVLRVMDVASWKLAKTIDLDSPIKSLAASAEHITVGYSDGTVAILNFGDQSSIPEVKKQKGIINALAFSPNGEQFASASDDHSVKVWDIATLKPICSLEGHSAAVLSVAFSPDGKTVTSRDSNGVLNFWAAPKQ